MDTSMDTRNLLSINIDFLEGVQRRDVAEYKRWIIHEHRSPEMFMVYKKYLFSIGHWPQKFAVKDSIFSILLN